MTEMTPEALIFLVTPGEGAVAALIGLRGTEDVVEEAHTNESHMRDGSRTATVRETLQWFDVRFLSSRYVLAISSSRV